MESLQLGFKHLNDGSYHFICMLTLAFRHTSSGSKCSCLKNSALLLNKVQKVWYHFKYEGYYCHGYLVQYGCHGCLDWTWMSNTSIVPPGQIKHLNAHVDLVYYGVISTIFYMLRYYSMYEKKQKSEEKKYQRRRLILLQQKLAQNVGSSLS